MKLELYRYRPLKHQDSIRLIILKESSTEELRCKVIETRLSDISALSEESNGSIHYVALSYVWGESAATCPILIGDKRHMIGENLRDALLHIRLLDKPIYIWADALCIDQSNLPERNLQVNQMREIYATASKTIVYLGNQNVPTNDQVAWNYLQKRCKSFEDHTSDLQLQNILQEDLVGFEAIKTDILQRLWFRRVWVLQEVVVSKAVFVQSGHRTVMWDEFTQVLLLEGGFYDNQNRGLNHRELIAPLADMFHARCAYHVARGQKQYLPSWHSQLVDPKGGNTHILSMLERARPLQASDPRDKIYALMGISTGFDPAHELIQIDYRKSVFDVYTDFAWYMISSSGYDILSHVGIDPTEHGDQQNLNLPSWAPDWTRPAPCPRTIHSTLCKEYPARRTHNNIRLPLRNESRNGSETNYSGRYVGKVTRVGFPICVTIDMETRFAKLRSSPNESSQRTSELILQEWERLYPLTKGYTFNHTVSQHSVEEHLISRSRQTILDAESGCDQTTLVIDRSSIVEGRSLVEVVQTFPGDSSSPILNRHDTMSKLYFAQMANSALTGILDRADSPFSISSASKLALAPPWIPKHSAVIFVDAARLPYIVSMESTEIEYLAQRHGENHQDTTTQSHIPHIKCKLVHECLMNDLEEIDPAVNKTNPGPKVTFSFV
jgi:hypothetical protein